MTAFTPFVLGRYNVLLSLGHGGMADVYLAEQRGAAGFSRLVCLKRVKKELRSDNDVMKMFVDEANMMVNIRHPNVVEVLELEEDNGELFMVLEYVDGTD